MRFPSTLAELVEILRAEAAMQCRKCCHRASVTAGTVLHETRLPLRTWLPAVFFVARHEQGISARQLQADAGIGSYRRASGRMTLVGVVVEGAGP